MASVKPRRKFIPVVISLGVIVSAYFWYLFSLDRTAPGGPHLTDDQMAAEEANGHPVKF